MQVSKPLKSEVRGSTFHIYNIMLAGHELVGHEFPLPQIYPSTNYPLPTRLIPYKIYTLSGSVVENPGQVRAKGST